MCIRDSSWRRPFMEEENAFYHQISSFRKKITFFRGIKFLAFLEWHVEIQTLKIELSLRGKNKIISSVQKCENHFFKICWWQEVTSCLLYTSRCV